jgi:molybdate transport system substrate-binding protein
VPGVSSRLCVALAWLALVPACSVNAAEATIGVAANFTHAAKRLAQAFEAKTGHRLVLSFGSTGQLFTQITYGAPYDVLLSADTARPEQIVAEGLGIPGTRFTYATGILVLWSADPNLIDATSSVLTRPTLGHVAIANPVTAPYGAAAIETMKALGLYHSLRKHLVQGKSVSQAYQFVSTRNAPLGFVALSQIQQNAKGSRWIVPDGMHQPLSQDAVLLERGRDNEAAKAFLEFLKGPKAVKMIKELGYRVPGEG